MLLLSLYLLLSINLSIFTQWKLQSAVLKSLSLFIYTHNRITVAPHLKYFHKLQLRIHPIALVHVALVHTVIMSLLTIGMTSEAATSPLFPRLPSLLHPVAPAASAILLKPESDHVTLCSK